MSGTSLPFERLSRASAARGVLCARTIAVVSLDAHTRSAAYALFRATYENACRERFEHDLAEKQHIILLYDSVTDALKGFSTVLVRDIATPSGRATVVFSGDTVIDRDYWGQKQLQLAFARLLVRLKLRAPWRPLYWFLVSKGYRTYLLLANSFPLSVPRVGVAEDAALRLVLDGLAVERFGEQYDRALGVVRYATPHERVRDGVAPVTETALRDPHVRYFVERNSEHANGVELACLADVRLGDVACAVARIARLRVQRALGGVLSR
ncbi:MAG: hypothetical protein ABI664_19760 [bacterium]